MTATLGSAAATVSQESLFNTAPAPNRIRNQAKLLKMYLELRRKTFNRERYCWASNEYFARTLGWSIDTVTRVIARLQALGAITVVHLPGIERQVRILLSIEQLKALLFRGHESNRRQAPAPTKPRPHRALPAPPSAVSASPSAEGSADTVAEGQYKESRRDSCQTLPTEEGQQQTTSTDAAPKRSPATRAEKPVAAPPAELSKPLVDALGEAQAHPLAKLAQKLARTPSHVRQCVRALCARKASGQEISNEAGYLRRLIEAPEGTVGPPAPPPSHPSDRPRTPEPIKKVTVFSQPSPRPISEMIAAETDPGKRELLEKLAAAQASRLEPGQEASPGASRCVGASRASEGDPGAADAAFMASLTGEQLQAAREKALSKYTNVGYRKVAASSLDKRRSAHPDLIAAAKELHGQTKERRGQAQ